MPREKMPSHRTRVSQARQVGLKGLQDAAVIKGDPAATRSTATRAAYKHKADVLDRVMRILAGKERVPIRDERTR